jgi:predicted acylesterase/phospholipase RssA
MIESNSNLRIGVVLSSGGGLGVFAHTGFLQALEQLKIEVSAIAGCSAGALVGGIYASGTQLQKWADSLSKINPGDYWTPDPWWRFVWRVLIRKGKGYTGISDNKKAINFIRHHLSVQTFEECKTPFYCIAFNLSHSGKTLSCKRRIRLMICKGIY